MSRTGDVLEVSTVLQPGAACTDVVRRALALNLDQDWQVRWVFTVPWLEWLKLLKAVAGLLNDNLNGSAVLRRGLEGVLSRIVTTRRELVAGGVREPERLAVRAIQSVGERVERQVASECHGSDDIGRRDERVCGRVSVITAGEIAVV